MPSRTFARAMAVLIALTVTGTAVVAQETEQPRRAFSSMLNVDALMDNYLRILARKYDLSDEQREYTEQFVRGRVETFLDSHHDELSSAVDRLFEVRSGAADMSQDELMQWGRAVMPLYQEAKVIIVEANAEWRGILTEEQCVIHDEDLRLMNESFATTEDQLQRVISGQMTVEEFRNPHRFRSRQRETPARVSEPVVVQPAPTAVPTPRRPATAPRRAAAVPRTDRTRSPAMTAERPSPTPPTRRGAEDDARGDRRRPEARPTRATSSKNDFESEWEAYVRKFIEKYELNEDQQNKANKILKSCQDQANRYMRSREGHLKRLDQRLAELKSPTDDSQRQEAAKLKAAREKMLSPIGMIFERQLKPRLEKLPTRAQRDAAEGGSRKDDGRD